MLHLRIIKFSIDMKRIFFFLIITIAFFSVNAQNLKPKKPAKAKTTKKAIMAAPVSPAIIYDKAEILFDTSSHDFKEIFEGQDAIYIFKFYNIGREPLTITDAHPGCSCTVSDYTKEPVMPGKSGSVTVKYATHGRMGTFAKSVSVTSTSYKTPVVTLIISGNVIAAPQETR